MPDTTRGPSILKTDDDEATQAIYDSAFPIIAAWAGVRVPSVVPDEPLSSLGRDLDDLEEDLIDHMPATVSGTNGIFYESDADEFDSAWQTASKASKLSTVLDAINVICDTYCQGSA
ncbi:MAG: hypothetical protein P4L92_00995 [Rudaea sp.]|nr:hypothetical protein [Rudaea sp.]